MQRFVPKDEKEEGRDIFSFFFTPKGMRLTSNVFKGLSEEEKARLRLEIMAIHDQTIAVFKAIPSKLMLVTRFVF